MPERPVSPEFTSPDDGGHRGGGGARCAARAARVRTAMATGTVVATAAALYSGTGWAVGLVSAAFVGLLNFVIALVVRTAEASQSGAGVWGVLSSLGRATSALAADTSVTIALIAISAVAIAGLVALQRLLGSDEGVIPMKRGFITRCWWRSSSWRPRCTARRRQASTDEQQALRDPHRAALRRRPALGRRGADPEVSARRRPARSRSPTRLRSTACRSADASCANASALMRTRCCGCRTSIATTCGELFARRRPRSEPRPAPDAPVERTTPATPTPPSAPEPPARREPPLERRSGAGLRRRGRQRRRGSESGQVVAVSARSVSTAKSAIRSSRCWGPWTSGRRRSFTGTW